MEIVINRCFGGFGLSHKAIMRYAELAGFRLYAFVNRPPDIKRGIPCDNPEEEFFVHYSTQPLNPDGTYQVGTYWSDCDLERNDPILIQVVKELGEEASDRLAKLEIVDIPDDVKWHIREYDGCESIHEDHREW